MDKYMPDADHSDQNYVNSFNSGMALVLKQCGNDLSRQNIMKQAANLHDLKLPMLLRGITVNTGPHDYYPVKQMQLMRWDGSRWVRFGRSCRVVSRPALRQPVADLDVLGLERPAALACVPGARRSPGRHSLNEVL